jgi:predicted phosphodiesterase
VANPDHSKIYITLDDGKWCYHNGSAFVAGGVYQATAIETDKTLAVSGAAADSKVTGDKVGELKSALNDATYLPKVVKTSTTGAYINCTYQEGTKANVKQPSANVSYEYWVIPCEFGDRVVIDVKGGNNSRAWAITDEDYTILSVADAGVRCENLSLFAPKKGYFVVNNNTNTVANATVEFYRRQINTIVDGINVNIGVLEQASKTFSSIRKNARIAREIGSYYPRVVMSDIVTKEYTAVKTNENWQEESYALTNVSITPGTIVQVGCYARDGLGINLGNIRYFDSSDNVIDNINFTVNNTYVNGNGGFISKPFVAPALSVRALIQVYGISNANTSGEASVIGKTYGVYGAFAIIGSVYGKNDSHIVQAWANNIEWLNTNIKDGFCFGIQTDTHYVYGRDANVGFDMSEMSGFAGMDFIANLGDIIEGFVDDDMDSARESYTEIVKRYTDMTSCPVLFAVGNHDSNYLYANANSIPEISNAEIFARLIKKGLRTSPMSKSERGKLYYYTDFDSVRVITLNTGDSASANSFVVSEDQITWFTTEALNTDKAVLVLSHVPIVNEFSTNYGSSYASIVSALQNFKNNGGTVIACIAGHTHSQGSAVKDGILYVTCTRTTSNSNTAEIFIVDLTNRSISTLGLGSAESRTFNNAF